MKIFVARQPIFDPDEKVEGYELLFRNGPQNFFPQNVDSDHASSRIVHDSLNNFGLDELTGRHRAYINITRRLLVERHYAVLPRQRVVVELLETIEPDDEVIAACHEVKQRGYTLALDDFVFAEKYAPLLALADIIKIDFLLTKGDDRRLVAERLAPYKVKLLAEKVETREDFKEAIDLGYTAFQGYFFCKPEMIVGHDVPQSKLTYLQLLAATNEPNISFDNLVRIVRRDPALSVKLLRYLNSAFFATRAEISSLKHAITMLGEEGFRRWTALFSLAGMGEDRPPELLITALHRAYFCEKLAGRSSGSAHNDHDFFLIGMLSQVDALVGRPLEETVEKLNLQPTMRDAILRVGDPNVDLASTMNGNRAAQVLALAVAYERGVWDAVDTQCATLKIALEPLQQLYAESLAWAQRTIVPEA